MLPPTYRPYRAACAAAHMSLPERHELQRQVQQDSAMPSCAARIKFITCRGSRTAAADRTAAPRGLFPVLPEKTPFGQFRKLTQNFPLNGGHLHGRIRRMRPRCLCVCRTSFRPRSIEPAARARRYRAGSAHLRRALRSEAALQDTAHFAASHPCGSPSKICFARAASFRKTAAVSAAADRERSKL